MQDEINDSVDRLLARRFGKEERIATLRASATSPSPIWEELAQLGLFGLGVPQEYEGFGGSVADLAGVFQRFGRALMVAPWLQAVLAAQAIARAGSPAQKSAWLPAIACGQAVFNVALESGASAHPVDNGWVLRGNVDFVQTAPAPAAWLVWAQGPGGEGAFFLVEPDPPGISAATYRAIDSSQVADVQLDNVPAKRLGEVDGHTAGASHPGLQDDLLDTGRAVLCAEAVGVVEAAFNATVEYLKSRQQFGVALSDNQALRHRVAEMYISLEQVRSMAAHAVALLAHDDSTARSKGIAQAKLVTGKNGKWITQQAIQLHGGMGMTDECMVSHYYRRMLMNDALFGSEQVQLDRLAWHAGR